MRLIEMKDSQFAVGKARHHAIQLVSGYTTSTDRF